MRKLTLPLLLALLVLVSACGGGGSTSFAGPVPDSACSANAQKQTVLDIARDWYLWNDRLPGEIDLNAFGSPNALLNFLMDSSPAGSDGQPVDEFSAIVPAATDQQFFGEGKFEGFGFGYRFEAEDDLRITRVYADSPASQGGLGRGQRIESLNRRTIAEIVAAEGVGGVFAIFDSSPVIFSILDVDTGPFEVTLERGIVTIDPVPQVKLIPRPDGSNVGYIELAQFISTADAELEQAFATFRAPENNVSDLIIDMRYNGGGLVETAERLADLLGGFVAQNLRFSETRFNADRADQNRFRNFALRANSINLSRLLVIATRATASASELVANGMAPHVDVAIVGDSTFGKPIGQSGFEFCDNILRLTAFQLFNADGLGDYFDGLPVTPGCEAPDDISVAVGADADPNMVVALSYLDDNVCPGMPATQALSKPLSTLPREPQRGNPARVYSDSL